MNRPLGIILLALLAVLGAIGSVLFAFSALAADAVVSGVLGLAMGGVMLSLAFGAWAARSWAWPLDTQR